MEEHVKKLNSHNCDEVRSPIVISPNSDLAPASIIAPAPTQAPSQRMYNNNWISNSFFRKPSHIKFKVIIEDEGEKIK